MTDAALFQNQYRITRLQVFNWGTFSNIHDIPIPNRVFSLSAHRGRESRRSLTPW